MEKEQYLDRLLRAHESYYDVTRGHQLGPLIYDGHAEYHSEASQYVLAKRAKLWSANTHDYIFFKIFDILEDSAVREHIEAITTLGLERIVPDKDHMTSYLTLIFITDHAEQNAIDAIRTAKFRKNFMLGMKGWVDLRCALADLSDCSIITNNQGSDLEDILLSCFEKGEAPLP